MDPTVLLEVLPKTLLLGLLAGFMIFLAKFWGTKEEPSALKSTQLTFFWGFFLFTACLVILLIQSIGNLTDKTLQDMPINAAVLSLSLATAILILRGFSNLIIKSKIWLDQNVPKIFYSIEKDPFPLFVLIAVFCSLIKWFKGPETYFLIFFIMFGLYSYIFDKKQFDNEIRGALFYYFLILFVGITILFTIVFSSE